MEHFEQFGIPQQVSKWTEVINFQRINQETT